MKADSDAASWRDMIPAQDWSRLKNAGYGAAGGLGHSLALVIVDVTYGFLGQAGQDLITAERVYPGACGPTGWAAVSVMKRLVTAARQAGRPILYTRPAGTDLVNRLGGKPKKARPSRSLPPDAREIVADLAPCPQDFVLEKPRASAFFATPLTQFLIAEGIDSLLVVGGTTSGCVRATVVDAASNGFATAVVEDAVFDRSPLSHAVNLFDIRQKYADVITSSVALRHVRKFSTPARLR